MQRQLKIVVREFLERRAQQHQAQNLNLLTNGIGNGLRNNEHQAYRFKKQQQRKRYFHRLQEMHSAQQATYWQPAEVVDQGYHHAQHENAD